MNLKIKISAMSSFPHTRKNCTKQSNSMTALLLPLTNGSTVIFYFQRLWGSGQATEVKGPVRVVHRYVDMPKQKANFYNATTKKVEEVIARLSFSLFLCNEIL